MPKTIRNKFYKVLSFESLMDAHKKSRKGKGYRNEIIKFNLKQEEYITWLYNELKNGTYKHSKMYEKCISKMGRVLCFKDGCSKIF